MKTEKTKNVNRKGERKNDRVLNSLVRRQILVYLDLMEELKLNEFAGLATKFLKKIYFTIYIKNIPRYTIHLEQIPCAPTQFRRITKAKVL